ncbi:protein tic 40 chloroplastic [Phtheirospermum japonicum]|uniref:Protein TIC 40, chloroplastic n=1 Tax=Phtheirospermum japonicum TaxID=374723 RepID=A0A830BA27_9LAMI|nr:protein tic 40 chloroplastic [Phtheirospermum japonicum]
MESLSLVSSHKIVLGVPPNPKSSIISSKPFLGLPNLIRKTGDNGRHKNPASSFRVLSLFDAPKATKIIVPEKVVKGCFASIASSSKETSSVAVNPQLSVSPPPSHVGSPLFWIGVGVGLSALFSWVAGRAKKYAMEQAFKTFTQQMNTQNSPFGTQNSPFAFVDVAPEETLKKNAFENYEESIQTDSPTESQSSQPKVSQNGTASKQGASAWESPFTSTGQTKQPLSVEALEKMMEDPTVQKMVYPYLPEEMRNPTTFKWMLQNPQYRQQLQDMLNNMGGSPEWDNRMMDSLKNFDLSSPEIKQQFDQIGLTPEEVISKIMANPDVARAFQNPRVQAAIMDCSQNPMSIAKYQNDKEVMDVFNKISELFPGASGPY